MRKGLHSATESGLGGRGARAEGLCESGQQGSLYLETAGDVAESDS